MNKSVIGIVAAVALLAIGGFALLSGDSTTETTTTVTPTPAATSPTPAASQAEASPTEASSEEAALTAATVATHSTVSDCWTIIDGKVYDITSYIPRHPGGQENIVDACGADGTALFEGQQPASNGDQNSHNSVAEKQLEGFLLGDLQ